MIQGSSPSPMRRFEPPPRNLYGIWLRSRSGSSSGMDSCLVMRSRSLVPPMPSDVSSAMEVPERISMPRSASSALSLESSTRIGARMLRTKQNHEFVAGSADVSGTDREDGVAGPGVLQQKFDGFLHGTNVMDVFVSGLANSGNKGFAGDARDRRFAGRIDVREDEQVGLIEGAAELIPEMLRARIAMRLEKNQQAVKLTAASSFERGANLRRVVTVVVDYRDLVHGAFYVEAAADAAKVRQSLA